MRRNVITAVERMTGLEVTEVNIAVTDIQIPGAEDSPDAPGRAPARARRVTVPHPPSTGSASGWPDQRRHA